MKTPPPMPFDWDGEAMRPVHANYADRHFVVGERYMLAVFEDRSMASHRHEFAWLADAWKNLPEDLSELYPSPEHLRKRALITAGYYDEEVIDAGNRDAAERVAAYARRSDEFALVLVRGTAVVVRTAKSQSRRAMDKDTFQRSKDDILEIVAALINVTPAKLLANTGRAA